MVIWIQRATGAREDGERQYPVMETYRGVPFSIPRNDDGVWHYKIHPGPIARRRPQPVSAPAQGFPTREAATVAARQAIDFWIQREVH